MKKTVAVIATLMSVIALSGTPAYAAPPAKTSLLLSVYTMNDGSGGPATKLDAWYLSCSPPSGTHPNPKKACKVLTKVDGWIEAIERDDRACTKEYKPVTLWAEGTWKGRSIYWAAYFGNRCEAAAATQDLFPV